MQCKILLCYPFPILSTRSSFSLFLLLLYYIPDSYTSSQFIWERHSLFLCCLYLSKHEIPCWFSCVFSVRTEWNGLIPKIQPPREGGEGQERERERNHLQIPAYAAVKALHASASLDWGENTSRICSRVHARCELYSRSSAGRSRCQMLSPNIYSVLIQNSEQQRHLIPGKNQRLTDNECNSLCIHLTRRFSGCPCLKY